MGKGSQTVTTSQAPNPQAMSAYQSILQQAQNVAATPYMPYGGELVAPVTPEQYAGISNINAAANSASPYIAAATQYAIQGATPISAADIANYVNPYTQNVVGATEAQFANQNALQQAGVLANAIAQGALGGNRTAIAQSELANQQQLAQAPVIAALESQGYQTGLGTALAEQQAAQQGAYSLGNLGISGEQAALLGAQAQMGAGAVQQQTQQALDQALYQQYLNQMAYPFQTTQWLAGIGTGVGSQMGGTGTTTYPQPSMLAQMLGLGTLGAGIIGGTGGFGSGGWLTSLMSDQRVKENIRKIGELNDGQPIFRFNYKGDPTVHVGLLAQKVEKKHPEAVHEINGIKHVDYDEATRGAAGVGRYADGGMVSIPTFGGGFGVPTLPYSGRTWVPMLGITHGPGAPPPPGGGVTPPGQPSLQQQAQEVGNLARLIRSTAGVGPTGPIGTAPAVSALGPGPYRQGGRVRGYQDGGSPTFSDRWTGDPAVQDQIISEARAQGVDPAWALSVARQESGGRQYTASGRPKVSPAGAVGVMQLEPGTAHDLGVDPYDTEQNIRGGVTYLRQMYDRYGDKGLASAAYNAGPGRVDAFLRGRGSLPAETMAYVPAVTGESVSGVGPQPLAIRPAAAPPTAPTGVDWSSGSKLWPAIMAAGLGMMASRSPFPGVAIGEGGLTGMQTYAAETRAEMEARRLAEEAEIERSRVALAALPYTQMTAYQQKQLAQTEQMKRLGLAEPRVIREVMTPMGPQKIYGTMDASGKLVPMPEQPEGGGFGSTTPPPGGYDPKLLPTGTDPKTGIDPKTGFNEGYLLSLSPEWRQLTRGIANYDIDPNSVGYRAKAGLQQMVANYSNGTYRSDIYPNIKATELAFNHGKQGDQVRFFNNAIQHESTLLQYFDALNNGDVRAVNSLKNWIQTQFGVPAPNTVDGIKNIVGMEIVKSIVPGGGGEREREEMAQKLATASSPQQIRSVITALLELGGAQLYDLKKQYEAGTYGHRHDFETRLIPASIDELKRIQARAEAQPAPPPEQRTPDTIYQTPRGPMRWTGTGWLPLQ